MQRQKETVMVRVLSAVMAVMLSVMMILPVQAAPADAASYAAVFDYTYYLNCYPDLQAAIGADEAALLNHFLTCGMAEGRQGCAEFNVQYYKERYVDLQAAFGDNLPAYYMHYMTCGKAEGRQGNGAAVTAEMNPGGSIGQQTSFITGPVAASATAAESEYAYQVLAIMNQIRVENGLNPLITTQELMNTAQQRAKEITIYFSHERPDGSSCFTAYGQNGVSYRYAGENIAAGQNNPEFVMESWMNSPGHRANILTPQYGHVGIGCCYSNDYYGIYWSQNFTD